MFFFLSLFIIIKVVYTTSKLHRRLKPVTLTEVTRLCKYRQYSDRLQWLDKRRPVVLKYKFK